ncbi:hypothetical protein EN851_21210 [Mesorhizobium sp. M8A.F.Ca.ET.208.01.1.1]|uniref:hypothetical protein n=1 Tax=unclassified Mesorhizobium TaxID=325217 RepID=UPI001093AAB8|nr:MULTISPECIES: hypothetical protein [unclassified Mesorhizobium]TGQ90136.1 hypothetical protein EN851_21210 [Mesorhizobium sp. M8A.F.Ca.ET.208.01.1.1]TGT50976.1 hypothetical protein EN810_21110 [Mesorhizobium sp. M8A.F.Ca.ET.167.01.1.1]
MNYLQLFQKYIIVQSRLGDLDMKIRTTSAQVDLEGEHTTVEGICVTCGRSGHEVEVFGTESNSYRRAAVMLKEECPRREKLLRS